MRGAAPGNAPRTHLEQVMGGIAGTRKTQSAPNTLSLPRNMHLGLGRTPGYWSEAVFGVKSWDIRLVQRSPRCIFRALNIALRRAVKRHARIR